MFPDRYFASNYFAPRYFPRPTTIIIVIPSDVEDIIGGQGGNMGFEEGFNKLAKNDREIVEVIMIIVSSGILEE